MNRSPKKFAQLLTQAIKTVVAREPGKTIRIVQDELGYALDKKGGASIERWRKGYLPAKTRDIEILAGQLIKRGGLQTYDQAAQFLKSAGYLLDQPEASQILSLLGTPPPAPPQDTLPPDNPFIAGPPISQPHQFFGREQELRHLLGLWRRTPLQNAAIIGLNRSGKTSLLHYLKNSHQTPPYRLRPDQHALRLPSPERYRWVFVDFQDGRLLSRERLLAYILAKLGLPPTSPCNLLNFMDVVADRLHGPAIILLDEIGAALESAEFDRRFWNSLRSLGSNQTGGNLAFVLTAHQHPAELARDEGKTSPFFNIFGHTLTLGPWTEPEAAALLNSSPLSLPEADIAWILEHSRRWPVLVQCMAHALFNSLIYSNPGQDWKADALRQIEPYRYLLT